MYSRYERPQKTPLSTWIKEAIACVCCMFVMPALAVLAAVAMGAH